MTEFYNSFRRALTTQDGRLLASIFEPNDNDVLRSLTYSANAASINREAASEIRAIPWQRFEDTLSEKGRDAWADAMVAFWHLSDECVRGTGQRAPMQVGAVGESKDVGHYARCYIRQTAFFMTVYRGFTNGGWPNWYLPLMYTACRYMRMFAVAADEEDVAVGKKSDWLEDAARNLNKAFMCCLSDRAPLDESRKWGTYYIVNLLFKTYFKLNTITLSKNIIRALHATTFDMPPLDSFPKSHIVTFRYYVGVIHFLEEDYLKAEENLTEALKLCHTGATRNRELILTYLIPAHLITVHHVPSPELYSQYPRLQPLFAPICAAIRHGNLFAFDAALSTNEEAFVRRRIYLTLERARDICLRNLFRKVFLEGEKKTRVPVEKFRKAMGFAITGGEVKGKGAEVRAAVETEEVECLLAGMVYKGLMKGYISREKGFVVLSGKDAFPGTGC